MSNSDRRLPLAEAQRIAEDLRALLKPACERIEIAGSIRRQKVDVGDVELVCIPIVDAVGGAVDMFGAPIGPSAFENRLDALCHILLESQVLQHRFNKIGQKAWGKDLKWGVYQDFAVDIYSATRETWGVTLAIRTGSAGFSHKLVTPRAQGGFCPDFLRFKGWRVVHRGDGEALDTPEEEDVFEALGIEYIKPTQRFDSAITMRRTARV